MISKPQIPPKPWTAERLARLKTLISLGYSAKQIAVDPIVHTTERNVRRQSNRMGIKMSTARLIAPIRTVDQLMRAATVRGMTVQNLVMEVFDILGEQPDLLDNILDDDIVTPRD